MSPNEAQLRAALRDGEGDELDADRLISTAVRTRRERNRRITTAFGTAAAVALVGVGVTALVRMHGGSDSAGSSAGGGSQAQVQRNAAGAAGSSAGSASSGDGYGYGPAASTDSAGGGTACPRTPDRFMLPGGGGSGQYGTDRDLFPARVNSVLVCGYPQPANLAPRAVVLRNADANELTASINAAPATNDNKVCHDTIAGTLELKAIDSRGRAVDPVVITINCSIQVSNGRGARYLQELPPAVAALLRHVPDRQVNPGRSGVNQGSPPH